MESLSFGDYLKNTREKAGLGINELAKASGVSAPYLSRLESGARKTPLPDVLKKLAPHLKVSYEEMMRAANYIDIPADPKYAELRAVSLADEYIQKGLTEADIRRILDSVLEAMNKARSNNVE